MLFVATRIHCHARHSQGRRDIGTHRRICASACGEGARQYLGGMVIQAIRDGLREDGKLLSLRGTVPKHLEKGHIPAATDPREVAALVKAIDDYPVPVTRNALKLAMYTAMRPGIVASARWQELDLNAAEWTVAAERMKTRHAHIVRAAKASSDSVVRNARLFQRRRACVSAAGTPAHTAPAP